MRNSQRAMCAKCGKPIAPGEGKFVGRGIVVHATRACNPEDYRMRHRPSQKRLLNIGNKWLAPALLGIGVVLACSVEAESPAWNLYDPHQGVIVWSDGSETPITCAQNLTIGRESEEAIRAGRWLPSPTHTATDLRAVHWWRSDCTPGGDAPYRQ